MKKDEPAQMLSEKIAETIRQRITGGEFATGSRLSEASLSEQLEISRNTLREAFRLLTQEGLLHYAPNRGVYVAIPDMADILDIYRIRRLIECDALANAYAQHPAVAKMAGAVENARHARLQDNWQAVGTANMVFHSAIVELADSERLSRLYRHISAELRLAFGHLNDPKMLYDPYIERNAEILAMLNAGQNQRAADELADYLALSERTLLAALSRHKSTK